MISRSTVSAVLGLVALAKRDGEEPVSLREIAKDIRELSHIGSLSEEYVAKLFQTLSKVGIVRSVSGPKGGYALAKSPEAVSFWDVFEVVQGGGVGVDCDHWYSNGGGPVTECKICDALRLIKLRSRELLESIKIADMAV